MSDLSRLSADLKAAGTRAGVDATAVVKRGALNVKRGWAQNVRITSGGHLARLPYTISYDVTVSGGFVTAEVGPDKGRGGQANLGAIDEYGSRNNPPHMNGQRALDDEAPEFYRQLERIVGKVGG